jgi:hypothetical protein
VQANDFAGVEWFVDVVLSRNHVEGLHDAGCKRAYLIGDDDPNKLNSLQIAEKIRQLRLQGLTEEQIKKRFDPWLTLRRDPSKAIDVFLQAWYSD